MHRQNKKEDKNMKVKEKLSPQEMDNIKGGGFWYTLPDGTQIWIECDEEGEEPNIVW